MREPKLTRSSGNVFAELGFPPEEITVLTMRSDLIARLRQHIERKGWTQAQAAAELGINLSRVSDLVRGKWDKFSLDMLLVLATRAKLRPKPQLQPAA